MLDAVLAQFPAHAYSLTVVSDPDDVLSDEQIQRILGERGFRVISEQDPVALRFAVQQAQPFSSESPAIVVTPKALNTLPYDLWQQGYQVDLDLAKIFPRLAVGVIRQLNPAQRHRLSEELSAGEISEGTLGSRETIALVLRAVFDIIPDRRLSPTQLILWLDQHHASEVVLPPEIARYLIDHLKRLPAFTNWPLEQLLADSDVFHAFLEQEWNTYQGKQTRELADVEYVLTPILPIDQDQTLHDLLSRLLARNAFQADATGTARNASRPSNVFKATRNKKTVTEALTEIEQSFARADVDWKQWQIIARQWAEATTVRYTTSLAHPASEIQHFEGVRDVLDDLFLAWLQTNYASLAGRGLPNPHHLHHVPRWLAYQRQDHPNLRQALLVLDGMSLADWLQIRIAWQTRHPTWTFTEQLLLAQIPSVTAISRQALISGRRPVSFADSLKDNRQEASRWTAFWQSQDPPINGSSYAQLPAILDSPYPDTISSRRTQALCLISPVIDDMVHGATQGAAEQQAALQVWLQPEEGRQQRARWLEGLIQHLFDFGYTVTIASDHGHVEAIGMGQPQEGVLVLSRSKRARIYQNLDVALEVQNAYPDTVLWHGDGLLPEGIYVLMPRRRRAFVTDGSLVVSHGGLTIEEMIVPLVTVARS